MPDHSTPPTAETVGLRVTVRYRVGELATDIIGHVESVGDMIEIRHRDRRLVSVDPASIVVWKVVPERRV